MKQLSIGIILKKTAEAEKICSEILSLNPTEDKRIHNIINSTKDLIVKM